MLLQMPKFHSLWWLSSIPLGASQVALVVKNARANAEEQGMWFPSLDQEDCLNEGMATHSSILAWKVPWTEEPGGYGTWRLRVRHDWEHWAWAVFHCISFFIHSSVDGHLGCFHVLPIVNNAPMNIKEYISSLVNALFSLHKYVRVELLDLLAVLF